MKGAIEFLKKYGINDAKQLVLMGSGVCEIDDGISFHTSDLKRLVESHELVESYGGLSQSRRWMERTVFKLSDSMIALKKAIYDVESCQ